MLELNLITQSEVLVFQWYFCEYTYVYILTAFRLLVILQIFYLVQLYLAIARVLKFFALPFWQECFDPVVAKSGRDLIPVMVYGYVLILPPHVFWMVLLFYFLFCLQRKKMKKLFNLYGQKRCSKENVFRPLHQHHALCFFKKSITNFRWRLRKFEFNYFNIIFFTFFDNIDKLSTYLNVKK